MTRMHSIEAELIKVIESGRDWQLEDLGGITKLALAARSLGCSPLMPELLHPLMLEWRNTKATDREAYKRTLFDLLEVATTDFVLIEAVDILELYRPLPDNGDEGCFRLFLAKVVGGEASLSDLSRGAALDGAFRWAGNNRRWQLQLLDFFLGLNPNNDIEFLRYAAKVVGVAFSHWRDKELVEVLRKLAPIEAVRPEATFELGMAFLAEAMDKTDSCTAAIAFSEASEWFRQSESASDFNPEAGLYHDGLVLLLNFHNGASCVSFSAINARVQQHGFNLCSSSFSGPPWLGSRQAEAVCWSAFASCVAGLTCTLEEPSWWEPAVVIEGFLLSVYSASRSILRRDQNGGIEAIVRPRIRKSVATQKGQAHQIHIWLKHNVTHDWSVDAQELLAEIDALIEQSGTLKKPPEEMSARTSLTSIISSSKIPEEYKNALIGVVKSAVSLQLDNLTGVEAEIIERCCKVVWGHADYASNMNGKRLFDTVLLWLVRFTFNRLELTMGNDPTAAYLFERDDGILPHEDELQLDFFRWIAALAAGSDLEPTNVASGRADIRLRSGPERLVVEVKREEKDCSFDELFKLYAAQTTDYQNVSIRLGVLLVLDIATPNREGTPHLSSLFDIRQVFRSGELEPRLILIVKMPGRRKRPSDLTKLSKSKRR